MYFVDRNSVDLSLNDCRKTDPIPNVYVSKLNFPHYMSQVGMFLYVTNFREGLKKIKMLAFDQLGRTPSSPPPKLALGILKNFNPFFKIIMDSIHFKTYFSI